MQATETLDTMAADLARLRAGDLGAAAFSARARTHTALLASLPPAFTTVLHDLLDRLESGALFSEESCSFSQSGLLEHLQLWLDKANQRLR